MPFKTKGDVSVGRVLNDYLIVRCSGYRRGVKSSLGELRLSRSANATKSCQDSLFAYSFIKMLT